MEFQNDINMLTRPELIKIEINEFNASKERQLMIKGEKYYKVENDILDRKMYRYEDEQPVLDETKTNNRLAHGFMHNLVDDKINYLLTKPYTMTCDDKKYLDTVQNILGKRFQKKLAQLGTETSNKGIAWLYPYIDDNGQFKTMKILSEQLIPLWLDNDHEELQAMIRYYDVEVYEGKEKKYVTKIEYHTPDGVEYYVKDGNGDVILDAERYLDVEGEDILLPHFTINNEPGTWGCVPFIPFKNNDYELPDLQFVKTLVDDYDLARSDTSNDLEDIKNIVYVLKGYGEESLTDFVHNLVYYRAVKLDADENAGIDTITTTIDIEAAKEHWETLKKDIFDFGQGVDENRDKLGNAPSGIALRFMYTGLDLKCNALEDNFKWAFEQLLNFVKKYMEITRQTVSDKEISIIFNRDIAINESQAITDCQNSKGVISDETIMANHPWVEDVNEEIKRIEKENRTPADNFIKQNEKDIKDREDEADNG